MNLKEAKEMEGTEFTYVFEDGDEIRAYVKKFDPEIGLTCMSLETKTRDGWGPRLASHREADDTFCVTAVDCRRMKKEVALRILQEIRDTGKHLEGQPRISVAGPNLRCAFMK